MNQISTPGHFVTTRKTAQASTSKSDEAALPYFVNRRDSEHAITIACSPAQMFSFWRNFSNLALFMKDISQIEVLSDIRSKWTVQLQNGLCTEWISEITEEVQGSLISWTMVEGEVKTEGTVRFLAAPFNLGTVVSLSLDYEIPGGKLAEIATRFTGENSENLILTYLKRLKCLLETGEIATIEGQSSGREEVPTTKTHSLH